EPWLAQAKSDAARGEPETEAAPAAGPPSAKAKPGAPPLDLRRSKFHLTLSTPKLRVPYADFTDAQAELQVGAGGTASAPDVTVLRVAGKALGGDLSLKARLWLPSRVELESSGQGIDMERLMQVVSRASGKDLSQEIFGRGDVDVKGGLTDGMATADFKGKAEIRDGGFRFLPLPKSLMEKLSAVPALAARMNADAGTGKVTDSLEKARATFHLKGDRLDLQVEAADARMGTTKASGFVTLAGHCELAGTIVPSQKLLGDALHGTDATIPFVSQGEGWACGFKPELEKLALSVGKSKVKELLESKKGELGDGLKKSLKGLFGK
ncbi:MAG: hypothetical protein HY075_11060, partial [Deltaproteobacteria bacterium]|nr:hypothetical protein [Deltaproteobacteria bacterium]